MGFSGLFLELNSEDNVLDRLKQFSQSSHVHSDHMIVVLGAVHGFKQLFAHLHSVAVLVSDGDHVRDVEHSHVAGHGQILLHCELGQVPLRPRPLLEFLGYRAD